MAQEKVTIYLRNSVGKGGEYFGPGVCEVPRSFAESVAAAQGRAVADLEADAALVKSGVDLEAPQPRFEQRQAAPAPIAPPADDQADTGKSQGDETGASNSSNGDDAGGSKQGGEPDGAASGKQAPPQDEPIPDGFPAHGVLAEAGYTTLQEVRKASDEDLLAISGIGQVLLGRIREAQG